jgi:hypothetical protein
VVAGKWYPATEIVHQMAVWRALDLSESNGLPIDMVIALKFPRTSSRTNARSYG